MMKERFAKLLLGENMSHGSKGVSIASAISNTITDHSRFEGVLGRHWADKDAVC
eukprot:Gb_22951 [translate_table: standard]